MSIWADLCRSGIPADDTNAICRSELNRSRFAMRKGVLIQTEAERRRREAGVKQSMEIRLGSCMYACMWVGMVFGIISRTKARSAINEVPNCRFAERALLRHHIIGGGGGATSNQRAARKTAKISSAQSKNAREYWQQPTLGSEDSATKEVPKYRSQ